MESRGHLLVATKTSFCKALGISTSHACDNDHGSSGNAKRQNCFGAFFEFYRACLLLPCLSILHSMFFADIDRSFDSMADFHAFGNCFSSALDEGASHIGGCGVVNCNWVHISHWTDCIVDHGKQING